MTRDEWLYEFGERLKNVLLKFEREAEARLAESARREWNPFGDLARASDDLDAAIDEMGRYVLDMAASLDLGLPLGTQPVSPSLHPEDQK